MQEPKAGPQEGGEAGRPRKPFDFHKPLRCCLSRSRRCADGTAQVPAAPKQPLWTVSSCVGTAAEESSPGRVQGLQKSV